VPRCCRGAAPAHGPARRARRLGRHRTRARGCAQAGSAGAGVARAAGALLGALAALAAPGPGGGQAGGASPRHVQSAVAALTEMAVAGGGAPGAVPWLDMGSALDAPQSGSAGAPRCEAATPAARAFTPLAMVSSGALACARCLDGPLLPVAGTEARP